MEPSFNKNSAQENYQNMANAIFEIQKDLKETSSDKKVILERITKIKEKILGFEEKIEDWKIKNKMIELEEYCDQVINKINSFGIQLIKKEKSIILEKSLEQDFDKFIISSNDKSIIEEIIVPKEERDLIIKRSKHLMKKAQNQEIKQFIQLQQKNSIEGLEKTTKLASKYGNKMANLQRLADFFSGDDTVIVPKFRGISHQEVLEFIQQNSSKFDGLWKSFVEHISDGKDIESASDILENIQVEIENLFTCSTTFPNDTIIEEFSKLGQNLMVRSTSKEDTLKILNPGGNESVPNVSPNREEIAVAIGQVISSYFSKKSLGQRAASGDDIKQAPFMPVLLQVMVGEKKGGIFPTSGVMYTVEGGLGTEGVVEVSAGFGHAHGIVTGTTPTDLFYVQGDFIHGIVREKNERWVPEKDGGLGIEENPNRYKKSPCLTKTELLRLADIGKRLQESYGYPLDIEWTFDPKTAIFYLLQARPIPPTLPINPSFILPEKIPTLENITQITVVEAGGGKVRELTKENTLMCQTAKEAVDEYLKNPKFAPMAILIAQPSASNSHEAGFFRERGIPVIHLPGRQFNQMRNSLKTRIVLLDIQESFSAILPEGLRAKDYITEGLRRHIAPKMESACFQFKSESSEKFLEELENQSQDFKNQELKPSFGWNILDKSLNTFEEAKTPQERAHLLLMIIKIIDNELLSKIPEYERTDLRNKILYNAQHVWKVYNTDTDIKNKKFSMNWLRSAILLKPVEDVVESGTLYTALGGVKERKLLELSGELSQTNREQQEYLDLFQRSGKFIFTPKVRENWKAFINHLDLKELKQLAVIFKHIGPQVVEIWINSTFVETWMESSQSAQKNDLKQQSSACLTILLKNSATPNIQKVISLQKKAQVVAKFYMNTLANDFGDPNKFDQLLSSLDDELLPLLSQCLKLMNFAKGLETTLLSQSFNLMISAFDDCIKGLSESPHYEDNTKLKAERFSLMLDRYKNCCVYIMGFLKDPMLERQAKGLSLFMNDQVKVLKNKINDHSAQLLLPSKDFSVSMAALGSGLGDNYRIQTVSLADFFTLVHQSLIAASQSIGSKSGIKLEHLPEQLQSLSSKLMELNLLTKVLKGPTIQSITYTYPNISIAFNAPLNNHSAQFILNAKIDPKGNLIFVEFQGKFFVPPRPLLSQLINREDKLTLLALDSYYSEDRRIMAPNDYDYSIASKSQMEFKWIIPLDPKEMDKYANDCNYHLQLMVNYLQLQELNIRKMPLFSFNPKLTVDHPWCINQCELEILKLSTERQTVFFDNVLEGTLKNWNSKNLHAVLRNCHLIVEGADSDPWLRRSYDFELYLSSISPEEYKIKLTSPVFKGLLSEFVDRVIMDKSVWTDVEIVKDLLNFLCRLKPENYDPKDEFQSRVLERISGICDEELIRKIQKRMHLLPESIDPKNNDKYQETLEKFKKLFA